MALIEVTFTWSDEKGECYDCGRPAAYRAPDMYGLTDPHPEGADLFCSVCAALHASEGERIVYLFGGI